LVIIHASNVINAKLAGMEIWAKSLKKAWLKNIFSPKNIK
jgi:hypothetical protein